MFKTIVCVDDTTLLVDTTAFVNLIIKVPATYLKLFEKGMYVIQKS